MTRSVSLRDGLVFGGYLARLLGSGSSGALDHSG